MRRATIIAGAGLLLALAGCDGGSAGRTTAGAGGALKAEDACDGHGLPMPLRQTIVLLDGAGIRKADSAGFRSVNPGVVDAVLAIADPQVAVDSGALEPRERVSVYLAPADGTSPRALFTGCAPALSHADLAELEAGKSSLSKLSGSYFASGPAETVAAQAKSYRDSLTGAVLRAAEQAPDALPPIAPAFEASSFAASLHSASRLADPALGVPRFLIIAPRALAAVHPSASPQAARQAGFAAAKARQLDFGKAEIAVADAPSSSARDYVEAFLLGSFGKLVSWSGGNPTALPPAPAHVRTFRGTLDYVVETYPAEIRLAWDKEGNLQNSWFEVWQDRTFATPMSGTVQCDAARSCHVSSDRAGFAQAWAAGAPGGDAQIDPGLPFAGMRFFEATTNGPKLDGRVYDPKVSQFNGSAPGRKDMPFKMTEVAAR